MKKHILALALLCAPVAWGQNDPLPDYLGPGVLSRGAGNIGQRAGQDVDLRIYGSMSGIYDTGFNPVSVDGSGRIQSVGGLYGVEVGLGAYGKHEFRRGLLGVDYQGSYRHYNANQFFNGANQDLTVGYTWQKSARMVFDFRQSAGSSAYANTLTFGLPTASDAIVDATTLLFDNRTNYLQSSVNVSYSTSQRTTYTVGGNWNAIYRQSKALIGVRGYGLRGNIDHRFSTRTSVGVAYDHTHYDFPGSFGGSDIDTISGSYSRLFGRSWTTSFSAGVYRSQVEGLTQINVEPAIAALIGVRTVALPFYRENLAPFGRLELQRKFRNAAWSLSYQRSVSAGNGVYLTSRQESATTAFSYSGIRRWSFSVQAGYAALSALASDLAPYSQYYGVTDAGFAIADWFHVSAGFTARHVDVDAAGFKRNSTRSQVSLIFSPGNIPISFR